MEGLPGRPGGPFPFSVRCSQTEMFELIPASEGKMDISMLVPVKRPRGRPPNPKPLTRVEAIAALADTNERITAAEQRRTGLLLACDHRALDQVEMELAELRRYAVRLDDLIRALEAQAREAEEEARRQFRCKIVDRFEHLLIIKAAPLEEELEETIAKADRLFREIIATREEARAAWPLADAHHNALAGSVDGCALSAAAVRTLLCFELYRVGARPVPTGGVAASPQPNFPGGVCPRLDLLTTPD